MPSEISFNKPATTTVSNHSNTNSQTREVIAITAVVVGILSLTAGLLAAIGHAHPSTRLGSFYHRLKDAGTYSLIVGGALVTAIGFAFSEGLGRVHDCAMRKILTRPPAQDQGSSGRSEYQQLPNVVVKATAGSEDASTEEDVVSYLVDQKVSVDRIKAEAEREIRELLKKYPGINIEQLKTNCERRLMKSQSEFVAAEDESQNKTNFAAQVVVNRVKLCVLEAEAVDEDEAALRDSGGGFSRPYVPGGAGEEV